VRQKGSRSLEKRSFYLKVQSEAPEGREDGHEKVTGRTSRNGSACQKGRGLRLPEVPLRKTAGMVRGESAEGKGGRAGEFPRLCGEEMSLKRQKKDQRKS